MAFFLRARLLDLDTGGDTHVVVLRGHDAVTFGINPGDRLEIVVNRKKIIVVADITHHSIQHGELGLFSEVWRETTIRNGDPIVINIISRPVSVQAIKKKLLGQRITESEMFSIIRDIVDRKLSAVDTTYFVASGYVKSYAISELIAMVKAMAQTGDTFKWKRKLVVDKHSVGGLAGNRTTMVAIPIIAALGITIPKTSSRAITSPAGTADTMEVLAPVALSAAEVKEVVKKTNGCLIWGGGLSIAPADDIIIKVSRPMSLEPYDKMIVSIMAKKVAMGIKFLVIDLPYGPGTKVPNINTAHQVRQKFHRVAAAFGIKVQVKFDRAVEPVGQGIGPALEARDVVRVLQRKNTRPLDLETKAVSLAADLIELCGAARPGTGRTKAQDVLDRGLAWKKMKEIIKAQGGDPNIDANDIAVGANTWRFLAPRSGRVKTINNRAIDEIARTLGAPDHKLAGIFLHHKIGERVERGDKIFTLYSHSPDRITLARRALSLGQIMVIG